MALPAPLSPLLSVLFHRPGQRLGPALAILFAAGLALNSGSPSGPAEGESLLRAPLLRWTGAALLFLLGSLRAGKTFRAAALGLLFIDLGALRAVGLAPPALEGAGLPRGPVRVEAWVAEVPVIVTQPGPAPRTSFRTSDPELLVSIEGRAEWIRPGHKLALDGTILPGETRRNPGDAPRPGRPPFLWVEHPQCARALEHRPFRRPADGVLVFRERAHRLLLELYSPDTAGFLIAMLLGDRRLLPERHRAAMAGTGTIHFLAVSGLNVGMAMALVVRLPLPRRARLTARLLFLLLFTLVTGGAPPVTRAAVMLGIHCAGESFGRSARPLDTLGWGSLLILSIEPSWVFDVGFGLSVAAVFAIIAWAPAISGERTRPAGGRDPFLPRGLLRGLRRSLAVSIATSAGTAPLVLHAFYRFHPLGPLWNFLVGPMVTGILLGGALSVTLGVLHPALGAPAAWITEGLSRLLVRVLCAFQTVPGSCVHFPPPPAWAIFSAQALVVIGAVPLLRRGAILLALLLGASLLSQSLLAPRPAELRLIDVGAGACALLRAPGAGNYLIDCGPGGRGGRAGERIARALLASGVRRLDGVILSHPHADHLGGLEALPGIIAIGKVWVSPLFERFQLGRRVLAGLEARGIPVERASRGHRIADGPPDRPGEGLVLEVLHPQEGEPLPLASSPNDGSLVLRAFLGGSVLLLPGDIEEAGTARLLSAGGDLRSGVLVLPHHGRKCRLLPHLIERVGPRLALASGDGSGGGREESRALSRSGIPVMATWENGAIAVRLAGGSFTMVEP